MYGKFQLFQVQPKAPEAPIIESDIKRVMPSDLYLLRLYKIINLNGLRY